MRNTLILLGLAATSSLASSANSPVVGSSCTYSCPRTNSVGGTLLSGIDLLGLLQCVYFNGIFSPLSLCYFNDLTGGLIIGSCPKTAAASCPSHTSSSASSSSTSSSITSTTSDASSSVTTSDPATTPTSLPISTTTSDTATIPTSSSTSSPEPSATVAPGWSTSYDCAVDVASRVLASPEYRHLDSNTPLTCTSLCAARGFTIAAVEYSDECFCANGFVNDTQPAVAPTSQCHMPCTGDSNQTCGGGFRMQIYTNPSAPDDVAALPSGWVQTMPCAVDTADRVFADTVNSTLAKNTPATCINYCSGLGYAMAGVEYGNECFCGSSFRDGTLNAAPPTQCNFACSGAPSLTCGGPWAIQLYANI